MKWGVISTGAICNDFTLAAMTWSAAATEYDCSQTSGTLTLSSDLTCNSYRNLQWTTLVIEGSSLAGTEWSLCAGSKCILSSASRRAERRPFPVWRARRA